MLEELSIGGKISSKKRSLIRGYSHIAGLSSGGKYMFCDCFKVQEGL